jgi:DsbC/DsbD-like thiol-disulfide interchange protein
LLNEYVVEQHAFYGVELKPHHQNVPYPGYFVLDETGTVIRKRFEQSYRVRLSAEALLHDVLGGTLSDHAQRVQVSDASIQADAWFEPPVYRPFQELLLYVELTVPQGLHVYGSPVPEGYTPLQIDVDPVPGLVVGAAELPNPEPFRIEGLDEQFFIYHARVTAAVPLRIEQVPAPGPLDLVVRVQYAACSDTACFPPSSLELQVHLPAEDLVRT